MIHSRPDILTQLLALIATDGRLRVALDEQNSLYQVLCQQRCLPPSLVLPF